MKRKAEFSIIKSLLIVLGLLAGSGLFQSSYAQATVNINIGNQPLWGPTGYDYVNYYYLPDLNIYYNVPQQQWIYVDSGRWITTPVLPPRYAGYDLYRMHKVVINDNQPYLRNAVYQKKYASFKGRFDQQPIRDSRDSKYYVINNHPMHNQMANRNSNDYSVSHQGPQPSRYNENNGQTRRQENGRQNQANRSQGERRGPH